MKYYIPTSILNFNNIFSSETISPKSFFEKRGFGFSHWTDIHEGVTNNIIVLYNEPFSFLRPPSDVVDLPLLIEIETDEEFEKIDEGIFCCNHTIYLSLNTTKFIFFSEQDQTIALSRSDSSLEVKHLKLYRKHLEVRTNLPQKELYNINIVKQCNEQAIEQDYRINKMKGLFYGYYIGANLSDDKDTVKQRNELQELKEILSAIRSQSYCKPTITQRQRIETLLWSCQKDIRHVREFLELKPAILANGIQIKFAYWYSVIINEILVPHGFLTIEHILSLIRDEAVHETEQKPNRAIEWIDNKILKYEKEIKHTPLNCDAEEIIITDGRLSKLRSSLLSNSENEYFLVWINDILSQKQFDGKISPNRDGLSDELTKRIKNLLQDKWDGSKEQAKLNAMRKYVRGQDVEMEWKDDLYSSITALLKEGDDWEKLLAFMRRKGMTDYRLAFALYGELNGFANLTRDFTDIIFEMKDADYIVSFYNEVGGQLLGDKFVPIAKSPSPQPQKRKSIPNLQIDGNNQISDSLHLMSNPIRNIEPIRKINGSSDKKKVTKKKPKETSVLRKKTSRANNKVDTAQTSMFDMDFPLQQFISQFSNEIQERIQENWEYTVMKDGGKTKEQIKHFINLCKKEGRGEFKSKVLYGVFTDEFAAQMKKELEKLI